MHDSDPVGDSWPAGPVGSLRIWDAGAAWSQIEKAPGEFDWSRLDALVKAARSHHATALIVLGQTPTFYSSHPRRVGSYGAGASSMPDLAAWSAYVKAVVSRYHAPDVAFQVWNEANVSGYWTGTAAQMAALTAAARTVVDEVSPDSTLVAPAMATRLLFHRKFFREYYRQKVNGVPVANLVDVLSFQLYPEADKGPEASLELLAATRQLLAVEGVPADKPIWNTEINYGLRGGAPSEQAPPEVQAANVAKTYLLNAGAGVQRVYWYSWDLHGIANTDLISADGDALNPAGEAYDTVHRWLIGSKVDSCTTTDGGTWVCALETPRGPARVYWDPDGQATVRTEFTATSSEELGSLAQAIPPGGTTLTVGPTPVLVTSSEAGRSSIPPQI